VADLYQNLTIIAPELILALVAMSLLMVGSFFQKKSINLIITLSFLTLLILSINELAPSKIQSFAFNSFFIEDRLSSFAKFIIFLSSSLSIIMSSSWLRNYDKLAFEFPILILFSTLGMAFMVSANDLVSLYLAIELQSLPLYVLATFNRNDPFSSESGVKYFILGALSSGLLLYGSSLIYGFTGTIFLNEISQLTMSSNQLGITFGLAFLLAGIIFKISAVPFHMWAPDVYQGAATPVTSFFASVPKMAAMIVLIRILYVSFDNFVMSWAQIIIFVSLSSIILGSVVAIWQSNIKRLIAYSSIAHMGFATLALSTGNKNDIESILVYMIIYIVANIGFFSCLINIQSKTEKNINNISDLSGLSVNSPGLAISIALYMFSFAGIPPLAGFFAKYYIFMSLINEGLILLAIFALIASVIGAFYYIRFVKVMFFDEVADTKKIKFSRSLGLINSICFVFIFAFILVQSVTPLASIISDATQALN
tara:strand:+ start:2041 stop:3486 length:1446 start_codon:yes stop_codon:yes gene_type:complete